MLLKKIRAWLEGLFGRIFGRHAPSGENRETFRGHESSGKDGEAFRQQVSNDKNRIDLCRQLQLDAERVNWVHTRKEGEEEVCLDDKPTSEQIVGLIDQILNGQYAYLAVDFQFQGEGTYVKRLDKMVYRPYHSTLVIHQGDGKLACLFFSGSSMCAYELIADFYAYREVDSKDLRQIPVGYAALVEYVIHDNRDKIDEALCQMFSCFDDVDGWLGKLGSGLWSAQNVFPGGKNNYQKLRRELGLLGDE